MTMIYFGIALLFVVYLEMLGRAFLSFINKPINLFGLPVGFVLLYATLYISSSILTASNCSFNLILILYTIIVFASLIFIIKQIRKIDYHFDILHTILLMLMVGILLFYTANTTLGELHGFDTTHYLNMVSSNIGLDNLNTSHVVFGTQTPQAYSFQYTFQSYFYFASVMMFYLGAILSKIGIEFYYSLGFVWVFQIAFHFLFCELILIGLNKFFSKNYIVYIFVALLMVFGYGKLYYNSAFGFYGNTLRTITIAFSSLYLIDYLEVNDKKDLLLFTLTILASCSLSSTAVFSVFFYLFAIFFILIDSENNLFKIYSAILFVPLINLLTVLLSNMKLSIAISVFIVMTLWFGNNLFTKIFSQRKCKRALLVVSVIFMLISSYFVTGNIFDFSAFLNNGSEVYDMTLDYFYYGFGKNIIKFYKGLSLSCLFISLAFKNDNRFMQISLVLILVFFNPFCCPILNKVNVVYYRSYELILNPLTIIYMLSLIGELFKNKRIFNVVLVVGIVVVISQINFNSPMYYHYEFEPTENYDKINKQNREDIDIINRLKRDILYKDIENPQIVTGNILTQSFIPEATYYFGREYVINPSWAKDEYQLYAMFWPVIHYGDARQPDDVNYQNMCEYIRNSGVDYIVQDKNIEYFDEERNIWYSMTYKINECGTYPFYENEKYSLYYFEE